MKTVCHTEVNNRQLYDMQWKQRHVVVMMSTQITLMNDTE